MKLFIVLAISTVLAACSQASGLGRISVKNYAIKSIYPVNAGTVAFTIDLTMNNGGSALEILDTEGLVRYGSTVLGNFTVNPFTVASGEGQVDMSGTITVDSGVSVFSLIAIVRNFDPSQCSADVSTAVKVGALRKTIKKNNVPLIKYLDK